MKFDDYNLYDNSFEERVTEVAFTGKIENNTNKEKSSIIISPEFTTNGALSKAWRRIDGKVYLYKGSTENWNFSNTGYEPYSEYYASEIANTMGINAVKYDLSKWKGMLASACELFTSKEYSYVPIWEGTKLTKIDDIYKWCIENGFKNEFSDMIVFDSLILNHDRHLGNFGVLKDNKTGKYIGFAPIFDNGEGLLSKADIKAFESKESFQNYIKNNSVNISSYGVNYEDLVKAFCDKEQIGKLRKLLTFKFEKHPKYNLEDKRLNLLEEMIKSRAKELIALIERK